MTLPDEVEFDANFMPVRPGAWPAPPPVAAVPLPSRRARAATSAPTETPAPDGGLSDDELARMFTDRHGCEARYVAAWDRWLLWDGAVWLRDEKRRVFDLARAVCRNAMQNALAQPMTAAAARGLRQRLGSAATVWAVVKLAGTDPRHAVTPDQLDADPWLLNTPAGIVDLRTGATRRHDPAALCTKITGAAPGGECPRWLRFLERVQPDAEIRAYLRRLAGYGATGSCREHVLPFLHGAGRNGKGTFAHTIREALGGYAVEIDPGVLMESHHDQHPTHLAVLAGARFVVASEIDTGRRWNESRLKRLTGGDPISARFMGRDLFEFAPQFTLTVLANHKPGIRSVDEAIRARMHLVPFAVTVPAEERDPDLGAKLRGELGGILAWILQGCREWQARGLDAPSAVRAATDQYLDAEDGVGAWLAECCDRRGQVTLKAAHGSYRAWSEANAQPALGRNSFADQLAARGFAVRRDSSSNVNVISPLQLRGQSHARDHDF